MTTMAAAPQDMQQSSHGGGHGGGVMAALAEVGGRWRAPAPDDLLIALDDTDNLDSPGTGFRARELAMLLARERLGTPVAITRHQLLVDPRIPYTSHNSSACVVAVGVRNAATAFDLARAYLAEAAAPGSDVGLALLRRTQVGPTLVAWGARAKREVLNLEDARGLARECGSAHAELSGTGGGLIGSLAALGLHAQGNDGRLLWLRGIRELAGRTLRADALHHQLGVQAQTVDGARPAAHDDIDLGDWPRAIYRGHLPVLLVENNDGPSASPWRCVARELVKQLSS